MDYLNCSKDLTGLNGIFYMCPKNFKSFHTFFAEKRRVECKKEHFLSKKKFCVFIFIRKNECIKKIY